MASRTVDTMRLYLVALAEPDVETSHLNNGNRTTRLRAEI